MCTDVQKRRHLVKLTHWRGSVMNLSSVLTNTMSVTQDPIDEDLLRRLQEDVIDSYDEELEMEVDDRFLDGTLALTPEARAARRLYFKELFRLQGELVKLQDWVVHSGERIVVLFEGRDAAGKGGTIKRITQRLNPRVCRPQRSRKNAVVLPAICGAPARCWRDRSV